MIFPIYFRRIFRKRSPLSADGEGGYRDSWMRSAVFNSGRKVSGENVEGASWESAKEAQSSPRSFRDSDTIFDLLGSSTDAAHEAAGRDHVDASQHVDDNDLLAVLNDQYYQALESPHVLSHATWVGSTLPSAADDAATWLAAEDVSDDGASGPIRGLLSDVERLEEAFGPLRKSGSDLAAPEEVPEILRLFAPPEYHMAAARRVAAIPPPVARRDHHALAIDSPLAALNNQATSSVRESNE